MQAAATPPQAGTAQQAGPPHWHTLPTEAVPLALLVWPCHDISPEHTHPTPGQAISSGPIHVQQLVDGALYVHDGRHRAIRAGLAGAATIAARVLR